MREMRADISDIKTTLAELAATFSATFLRVPSTLLKDTLLLPISPPGKGDDHLDPVRPAAYNGFRQRTRL